MKEYFETILQQEHDLNQQPPPARPIEKWLIINKIDKVIRKRTMK